MPYNPYSGNVSELKSRLERDKAALRDAHNEGQVDSRRRKLEQDKRTLENYKERERKWRETHK